MKRARDSFADLDDYIGLANPNRFNPAKYQKPEIEEGEITTECLLRSENETQKRAIESLKSALDAEEKIRRLKDREIEKLKHKVEKLTDDLEYYKQPGKIYLQKCHHNMCNRPCSGGHITCSPNCLNFIQRCGKNGCKEKSTYKYKEKVFVYTHRCPSHGGLYVIDGKEYKTPPDSVYRIVNGTIEYDHI